MARLVTSFWFRAVLSLTILVYLLVRLDLAETGGALAAVDPRCFLAAVVVDAAARVTMIGRWALLLRSSGTPVSVWSAGRIFLVSSFVGMALPAGGADVTRAYALSRQTSDGREALASVAVDRLLGVSALLTLGVVGFALSTPGATPPLGGLVAGLSLATVAGICAAFWADGLIRRAVPNRLQRTPQGQWLILVAAGVARYRGRPGALTAVFGLSLGVQWLRIIEVFLLGTGLDLDVDLGYYLIFMPIGLLAFMLPISIAGIGVPQGIIVWLLGPVGVPEVQSFALSTLIVVLGMVGTLPGLWLYLRARRT
jgi:uncharacterized membrane protein YbhN (UPF0104 family)